MTRLRGCWHSRLLIIMTALIPLLATNVGAQPFPSAAKPTVADSSQQIADRIISSRVPVLVDFWAPWCAPCRLLEPILKDIEKEFHGKAKVMKVNVDIHRGIASYFRVSSIPAVFVVKDTAVTHSIPGLRSKEVYRSALLEAIGKDSSQTRNQSEATVTKKGKMDSL